MLHRMVITIVAISCLYGISFAENNTPDFRAGYLKGFNLGTNHAKSGSGMPLDWALKVMAKSHSQNAKPTNHVDYQNGFEVGFLAGYKSVKPFTRKADSYESLSWDNAKPGTKLYDYDESHDVTIVTVDQPHGIIIVKFVKSEAVEPKKLDAVSRFWFVKKQALSKIKR